MRIERETATNMTAVRLDTLASVEGNGTLVMADTMTGEVIWVDRTGSVRKVALGPHAIRLVRLPSYGR